MGEDELGILILISLMFWVIQTFYFLLNWLYWLQVKEYRVDRILSFLRTTDGIKNVYLVESTFKIILWFITLFFIKSSSPEFFVVDVIDVLSLVVFIFIPFIFIILISKDFVSKKMRKPHMTFRALLIGLMCIALLVGNFLFINSTPFLVEGLIINELLIILSPLLGILLTQPLVTFLKERKKRKVEKLLDTIKPKIIGITGSFGKTTTKEFIAQLLGLKFKVVKTIQSENTILGILNRILTSVKKHTEVLVAEVGAYKRGEIKEVMTFLPLDIGIITGIEGQHLELFGSLENVKLAKFELIEGIKIGGVALFCNNSSDVEELIERAKKERPDLKIISFSNTRKSDITYKLEKVTQDGITFTVFGKSFTASVHGVHFVEGLVAGIIIAREFKIDLSDIQKSLSKIVQPEQTMTLKHVGKAIVIDDSHNASEKGFAAALAYLKLFVNKRKAVITPGIIELGSESDRVHKAIGKLMSESIDTIILTKKEFERPLEEGLGVKKRIMKITNNPAKELEKLINDDYIILLEGRMTTEIYKVVDSNRIKKDNL